MAAWYSCIEIQERSSSGVLACVCSNAITRWSPPSCTEMNAPVAAWTARCIASSLWFFKGTNPRANGLPFLETRLCGTCDPDLIVKASPGTGIYLAAAERR